MIVETITKKLTVNNYKPKELYFSIDGSNLLLYFVDKVTSHVLNKIKMFYSCGLSIVVLTTDIYCPFINSRIKFISVNNRWFIHTLFYNPYLFKLVSYDGFKSKELAQAFSSFTGFKFSIVNTEEEVKTELSKIENAILIKMLNGIGDLLMLVPTIKALSKKGHAVDIFIPSGRECVFKHIPYVRRLITDRKQIIASQYKNFYDISLAVSKYSKQICQQHRIKVIAELCDLKLPIDEKLEIHLTDSEIKKGKDLIKGLDKIKPILLVSLDSVDRRRTYPEDKQDEFVNLFEPFFNLIIVSANKRNFSVGLNLTGLTAVRELFSLVYLSDIVLSVDTSTVHIAGVFNKPCIMLPSTVNPEWRVYEKTRVVNSIAKCYPCNERICSESLCERGDSCLSYIEQEKILNTVLEEATKNDLF